MSRVLGVLTAAAALMLSAWAWADSEVIPAIFTLATDEEVRATDQVVHAFDERSVQEPVHDTILQVAAVTAIPQPFDDGGATYLPVAKIGMSTNSENPASPSSQSNQSAAAPACNQCDGGSTCNQSGCNSSCNQCNSGSCCNHCGDCCDDCCPNNGCTDCCTQCYQPDWTFKAGALVMQRTSPRSTPLLNDTASGRSLMNASGFNFNWTGGVDASAIRRFSDETSLEIRYFGINQWRARQSFVTSAPADIPIDPPFPVPAGSDVTSQFDSRLYNAEVNWRHDLNDRLSWLAGFRWMEMHESLGITFPSTFINTVTDNQLYGGQLGADFKFWNGDSPLHIDTVIKAGVYDNSADNRSESRNQLAFVGEIGVTAVYQCCDHVALRAGYQVLWLDGVAVATDQLKNVNVSPNIPLDSSGNAFYHGAMFSVDFTW